MKVIDLFNLQGTLLVMILADVVLKRRGIIDEPGKKCLADLCVSVIIPRNIIKSCLIVFDISVLKARSVLLAIGTLVQLLYIFLNRFLFNDYHGQQKRVLQYCMIASDDGFLGSPIAEGIYGSLGLLYASVFLIPMWAVVWSAEASCFVAGFTDPKKAIRNIPTHPCLVTIYIGMFLMVTQIQFPVLFVSSIQTIRDCNSVIIVLIIGVILADVNIRTIISKTMLWLSVLRLILLPLIAFGLGLLSGLDLTVMGIGVIMTGMPAGVTATILAARYDNDVPFAIKCVVLTTLLSMVTIPIWHYIIGRAELFHLKTAFVFQNNIEKLAPLSLDDMLT